jgi:flagellar biosynthesis regulator FlaF
MTLRRRAKKAYQMAADCRDLREQEADVFRWANGFLHAAQTGNEIAFARAIANNRLLWQTVNDLLADPANALPDQLKAQIISVGKAVQREMRQASPDLAMLISINDNIIAGLSGQA